MLETRSREITPHLPPQVLTTLNDYDLKTQLTIMNLAADIAKVVKKNQIDMWVDTLLKIPQLIHTNKYFMLQDMRIQLKKCPSDSHLIIKFAVFLEECLQSLKAN